MMKVRSLAVASYGKPGVVYLVGAGPGDPGLLTLRGCECLRKADVVVYDALVNPSLLMLAPAAAERVPVGKRHGQRCMDQEKINALLIEHAQAGRSVVRLKGGDPFVFGRGGEELSALRAAGISCEVVPGVTAGIAAPAYAGISVTHRDYASAVAFVTGHEDPTKDDSQLDWPSLAAFPGTLVFYMGVRQLPRLTQSLMQYGMSGATPAAVIEWGTTPRQRTVAGSLQEIASRVEQAELGPPAVIVVGRVVESAATLNWFESRPLFAKRIVVTRPIGQALSTMNRLAQLGAEVLELPALRIEPLADWSSLDCAVGELARYGWVVFTSANGVQSFLNRVAELGRDARVFGNVRIAAIGLATADELQRYHLRADLIPDEANSESLVAALRTTDPTGRLLLIRAEQGRDVLPAGLGAAGIPFDEIVAYRVMDETKWDEAVLGQLERAEVDWITVTSPRVVRALDSGLPANVKAQLGVKTKLASISPLTSAAAHAVGWIPTVEAAEANMDALIDAIVKWEAERQGNG